MTATIYLISFFIFTLALGFVYLWYRYLRRRHTRERFSFYSLRILVGFFITNLGLILAFNPLREFLAPILNKFMGTEIPVIQLEEMLIGSGLTIICGLIISFTIRQLHGNWDGPKSTRQAELEDTLQKHSWLQDAKYYQKHRKEIEIYQEKEKVKPEVFDPEEPDVRPWYVKAKVLLNLYDRQYQIKDDDWYGEYKCYIGRYGQDGEKVGVLCVQEAPQEKELLDFAQFANSREGVFHKLIVAIKGEGTRTKQKVGDQQFEIRYQSELLNSLISLAEYEEYIHDYFYKKELENSNQHLADMYVPLEGHTIKIEQGDLRKDEALLSVESYILDWVKDEPANKKEHLVLLGDYGQGKTVLMHKLVQELLNDSEPYQRIPILIELRGMSPRNADDLDILGQWGKRFNASQQTLEELHRAGKLLLILDGFDEMDLVGDTEILFNHFSQLWRLAKAPKAKIILAGRPNLFADDEERRMALGIQEPRTYLPYSRGILLDQLRPSQIEEVLRKVQPETKEGILNAIKTADPTGSFVELVSRPSTLYQLSTVWDTELAEYKDQLNSAIVIQSFINKAYERQASKKSTVLTSFERDYFMMGVAVGMMIQSGYTNQIKYKDLQLLIQKLWDNYPPKLPYYTDAMLGKTAKEPLRHRLRENELALDIIIRDVQVGGILVHDLSGRDVFKFAHKSYLECLVSTFFVRYVLPEKIQFIDLIIERLTLMKVNAVEQATGFTLSRMQLSSDVERFNAELFLLRSNIGQLSSKILSKNKLPGKFQKFSAHNRSISSILFQQLIVNPFPFLGRYLPRLTGWCSLHPDQKWFLAIFLSSVFSLLLGGVLYLSGISKDILLDGIRDFNLILFLIWGLLVLPYKWRLKRLRQAPLTRFSIYAKLYLRSCELYDAPPVNFSANYQLTMLKDWERGRIILVTLTTFIFSAGTFVGTVTGTFAGTFASTFAVIVAIFVAGAVAGASEFGFVVTFATVGAFAGTFVGTAAGAFGLGLGVASAVLLLGYPLYILRENYQKAIKEIGAGK